MKEPAELSLEQQFELRSFESRIKDLSTEDSKILLVKLYETMMIRETLYKGFLRHEWSIGAPNINLNKESD